MGKKAHSTIRAAFVNRWRGTAEDPSYNIEARNSVESYAGRSVLTMSTKKPPVSTNKKRPHIGRLRAMERETGFEPATSTLARLHSTPELFPLNFGKGQLSKDHVIVKNKLRPFKPFKSLKSFIHRGQRSEIRDQLYP